MIFGWMMTLSVPRWNEPWGKFGRKSNPLEGPNSTNTFITNAPTHTLKKRLEQLIQHSQELKFLVGFFYFSGWRELYESLKNRND